MEENKGCGCGSKKVIMQKSKQVSNNKTKINKIYKTNTKIFN